uniref:Uncharacterized protein n=1 Tax=Anguilla anguilla TaxID=7936 RepID=A0A0E9X6V0_ANGAN
MPLLWLAGNSWSRSEGVRSLKSRKQYSPFGESVLLFVQHRISVERLTDIGKHCMSFVEAAMHVHSQLPRYLLIWSGIASPFPYNVFEHDQCYQT